MRTDPVADTEIVELEIGGMTCAACARRVEKKLNRVDGVTASVNFATERATLEVDPALEVESLIAVVERTGYTARLPQAEPTPAQASASTALSLALAVPVVALSMIEGIQFPGWGWVVAGLTAVVVFWSGLSIHRATLLNARHGVTTMDTLISVGTLTAFTWSLALLIRDQVTGPDGMVTHASMHPEYYFEVAAAVTAFVLLGRSLEARAKHRAGSALRALASQEVADVVRLGDAGASTIPASQLRVGDVFLARPGERIASDGVVSAGGSHLDLSLMTGESLPVAVKVGDRVVGGAVNLEGRLEVRATAVGSATALAQMHRLLARAQSGNAEIQRLADQVSSIFVPAVLLVAVATFALWLILTQNAGQALTAAVAVLIVACPCALGLATPTALLVGTGRAAQKGILIAGPSTLELSDSLDTIVLDKTGTLTTGQMSVTQVVSEEAERSLAWAASLEVNSQHPLARALIAAADSRLLPREVVSNFQSAAGLGVWGEIQGHRVFVGRLSYLREQGLEATDAVLAALSQANRDGDPVVCVGWDEQIRAAIVLADRIKPNAAQALDKFRALGLTPILLTGDSEPVAARVAAELGIEQVHAGVLPANKVDVVATLQKAGRRVAMVGDGINDAAALAQADLGIAMGTGTDVARAAADLTVLDGDLLATAEAIRLARRTLRVIRGNLFWAFAYNTSAVPIAAAGLLNPMLAGAAMAASSLFVVTNSLRLRRA